ncbi:MAG: NAD(P)-dependent oxidoreductase [Cyanobacteriota bacterium]|jgi:3-hydroxyisobutyrate dehydrogenase|nr:NAD(P)-dependent oxidoreductase [Synechococcus sp. FGCU3]MEB3105660.1 NAD(P)-dependent oxidoreductase [Cyanobacteriota bacterium]
MGWLSHAEGTLDPEAVTIALLGTGLLGTAIGQRFLEQGESLQGWNRHPERLAPLVALGAQAAASAADAIAAAEVVVSVLSDGAVCRQVLIDQAGGALAGRLVINMATIAPSESQELAAAVSERGGRFLEAPVLGSRPEALAGTLQVMAGGEPEVFKEALPLLRQLTPAPRLLGPVGAGLITKIALNQLIASLTHAFSLSLHLVQDSGGDVGAFMELLRGSALYAPTFDKKLSKLLANDFANPNFPTAHLRKDLRLFLASARQQGLTTTGLDGLAVLLEQAAGTAIDGLDYSALHRLTAQR